MCLYVESVSVCQRLDREVFGHSVKVKDLKLCMLYAATMTTFFRDQNSKLNSLIDGMCAMILPKENLT